jgi:hypothetical protein
MDPDQFDALSRSLFTRQSRRVAAGLLGGLLALPAVGLVAAGGKKRKKRKHKKHHNRKKPVCVADCGNRCGTGDGCGGTCACAAGSICASGKCQPCDVVHTGNDIASGEALRQKMTIPLDDDSYVYVCPGRYAGYFVHAGGNVVGAGSGADPSTSTILDVTGPPVPGGATSVLAVANAARSRMNSLRITGSSTANLHGVYVPAGGTMSLENCVVTGTRGFGAYGIMVNGTFNALETTISGNGPLSPSVSGGGGMYVDTNTGVLLEDCRVVDNQAYTSDGGGITLYKGNMSIFSTEISGNKALGGAPYRGGGIYSNFGTVFMNSETRITGNSAGTAGGGGIFRVDRGDAYRIFLEGATVSGNSPDNCRNVAGCTG